MITVNGKEVEWSPGLKVSGMLKKLESDSRFSFMLNFRGTVIKNNQKIDEDVYEKTLIKDGDAIKVIPLIFGG